MLFSSLLNIFHLIATDLLLPLSAFSLLDVSTTAVCTLLFRTSFLIVAAIGNLRETHVIGPNLSKICASSAIARNSGSPNITQVP